MGVILQYYTVVWVKFVLNQGRWIFNSMVQKPYVVKTDHGIRLGLLLFGQLRLELIFQTFSRYVYNLLLT